MSCFYHVTSQKATAVSHSFTCNFTGPNDLNLVVAKYFYLEIYLVTCEGLRLIRELPINGKISAAVNFKRNGRNLDSIIIVTEKADAAIIDCVKIDNKLEFVTFANGNIGDNSSILSDMKHEIIIDSSNQIILFKFYDGVFKAILMKDLRTVDPKDCETSQDLNVVAFRVEDGNILGIFSLYGSEDYASIGLFVEDNKVLNMKSFKMSYNQVEVTPDEWKIDSLPPDTQFIIPVEPPYCGILIVGNKNICYYNRLGTQIPSDIPLHKASAIVCYEKIDVHKYLLGDMLGRLYMIMLYHEGPGTSSTTVTPNSLKVSYLGEVCIPETITYLDNGVVFIGSTLGDSKLIRLSYDSVADSVAPVSIQVLEKYMNVGPIIDIELQEVNGQNQLLLCSGAYREGCIKIVRNGIGIQELLVIDQHNISNVWSLQFSKECVTENLIAVTWPNKTECLILNGEELKLVPCSSIDRSSFTILLSVIGNGDHMLQVTDNEVRLISMLVNATGDSGHCQNIWTPPSNVGISCASNNRNQIVVASGNVLYYLIVINFELVLQKYSKLSHEIACIDMSYFKWNIEGHDDPTLSEIVAVSFWVDKSVVLIHLDSMEVVATSPLLTSGILPRSILLVQFNRNASPYLMVGMDNGNLIYFQIDLLSLSKKDFNEVLIEQRRVTIGTGPFIKLSLWSSVGQSPEACVFVCSNHPSIIHYSDGRLLFSSINLKNEVNAMCSLNSAQYKNCLILVSESNIIFGSIDKIQKLHVRSIPLHESPRRMIIQKETDTVGLITMRFDTYHENSFKPVRMSASTNSRISKSASTSPDLIKRTLMRKMRDIESSHFILMNQISMEPIHAHSFYSSEDVVEQATTLTTMKLPMSIINHEIVSCTTPDSTIYTGSIDNHDDPMCGRPIRGEDVKLTSVFVVGTAYVVDDEQEPTQGCLYIFHYNDRSGQFSVIKTFKTTGTPFAMQEFDGKLLVTFNSSVQLVDLTKDDLHVICRYDDNIIALFLKRKDDFILIGDLMRSVTLLRYKPNVAHFELIAQHRSPHWTTAIEIIDDDKFLVAENEMNMYVVSRDFDYTGGESTTKTDSSIVKDERFRMVDYASIHVGQVINKFIAGNILMQPLLDESRIKLKNSILYGSTTGSIGQVFEINMTLYTFLKSVEVKMQNVLVPIGNFSHETWRSYMKLRHHKVAQRFIDGDLVENFQNLDLKDKLKVVKDLQIPEDFSKEVAGCMPCTVDDLTRIIEELSRFH